MRTFWRIVVKVEHAMQSAAIVLVLLLAFAITADVVTRKVTGGSIAGAYETVEQGMVFVVYLGLGYCQSVGGHLRVGMLIERASGRTRELWEVGAKSLALLISLLYLWQTGAAGITAIILQEHQIAMTDFPIWPAKAMVPIGMLFISLRLILQIKTHMSNARLATPEEENRGEPGEAVALGRGA